MKMKYLLTVLLTIVCINTWGQTKETQVEQNCFTEIDSHLIKEIGKEKADIVLFADSIVANTVAWEGCQEESRRLSESMSNIVKYTFCTPSMYLSNKKVYASFQPYLSLTFYKGSNSFSIQFDYDINKWMIKNENDYCIICHDLKNSALLPLFYILFPNNPLIENSYKKIMQ